MQHLKQLLNLSNQIRKDTESKCKIDNVERYVTGFNSWTWNTSVITSPIWRGAMFESSVIANASFFLAIHGFYEEACSLFRGIIDGFLARLYWDEKDKSGKLKKWEKNNGRSTNEYWEWESGSTKEYPRNNNIKELLGEKNLIKKYDEKYHSWDEIDGIFKKLDKFVHGRPESRHYDYATRSSSNITEFKKKQFDEWHRYLKIIYCIISILSILHYPELISSFYIKEFKELEPAAYRKVKNIIDQNKN